MCSPCAAEESSKGITIHPLKRGEQGVLPGKILSLTPRVQAARDDLNRAGERLTNLENEYNYWNHYHGNSSYNGGSVADARAQRDHAASALKTLDDDLAKAEKRQEQIAKELPSEKTKLKSSIEKQAATKAEIAKLEMPDALDTLHANGK